MWHPAASCGIDVLVSSRHHEVLAAGFAYVSRKLPASVPDVQKAPVVSTEKREHAKPGEEQNQVAIIQNCKAKGICWKGDEGCLAFLRYTVCCDWASKETKNREVEDILADFNQR